MINFWQKTANEIWTGRDDSHESQAAKRMFQVVPIVEEPQFNFSERNALIGFACDEGVKRNRGRVGAAEAPDQLRRVFANFAAHQGHEKLIDCGTIHYRESLEATQNALTDLVVLLQRSHNKTVVLGGGHETAYAHGLGLYKSDRDAKIGIINFDAHLDMRLAAESTSGTPFRELQEYCQRENRPFHYLCIGASEVGNTGSLLETAHSSGTEIIWDYECHLGNLPSLEAQLEAFLEKVDLIYLSFDLDALSPSSMFAVSAPASLGVDPQLYLHLGKKIKESGKLQALDFVEYLPSRDHDDLCARVAARFIWEFTRGL